jgi:hypothetical protein
MHTMKVLVIDSIGPNLDSVIGLLRCFPCLERLYVIVSNHIFFFNVEISISLTYDIRSINVLYC